MKKHSSLRIIVMSDLLASRDSNKGYNSEKMAHTHRLELSDHIKLNKDLRR